MNINLYVIEDYENERLCRLKKTNPNKPNFKPGDGFSPQVRLSTCPLGDALRWGRLTVGTPYGGVPMTAYYKRDCHGLRKTLAL
ncbi:MAG: hypothetical protein IIC00_16590 [Planctomycetes bacterium]|nr:hypothetical protein [Planctomycetota bacterium]